MRIYYITPRDDALRFSADPDQQLALLWPLGRGRPFDGSWHPLPVWPLRQPRQKRLDPLCDLSVIGAAINLPVLSERAKQCIDPLLVGKAQWLRLESDMAPCWMLNSLNVVDALDTSQSKVTYFADGRVSGVDTYAFVEARVANEWLFQIATFPYFIFVTDRFRDHVTQSGLTGFHFQPMWDSEHRPFRPSPSIPEMLTRPEIYGPGGVVPNMQEYWPPEWKEQERQMKRNGKAGATIDP